MFHLSFEHTALDQYIKLWEARHSPGAEIIEESQKAEDRKGIAKIFKNILVRVQFNQKINYKLENKKCNN